MNMKRFLIPAFLITTIMASGNEVKLSNFITNTSFSGDARINYTATEYNTGNPANLDKDVLSTRFRLNLSTKINDNFSVRAQLRITNGYEIGGANSSKDVVTQWANLNYKFGNHLIQVGRLEPFYTLNSLLYTDGERDAIAYSTKVENTQLRAGIVFPYDSSNRSDEIEDRAKTLYGQAIHTINFGKDSLVLDLTGLSLVRDEKNTAEDAKGVIVGGYYTKYLNPVVETVKVKGQYAQSDNSGDNKGFATGIILGANRVQKKGDWRAEVEYKMAEKDNKIAKTTNAKNVKLYAQTFAGRNSNLEVEYNKMNSIEGAKSTGRDYETLSVSLNHAF